MFWDSKCCYLPRRIFPSLQRGVRTTSLSVYMDFGYTFSNDTQLLSPLHQPLHLKYGAESKPRSSVSHLLRARTLRERHATPNATVRPFKDISYVASALTHSRGTAIALSSFVVCAAMQLSNRESHAKSAVLADADSWALRAPGACRERHAEAFLQRAESRSVLLRARS